MPPATGQVTRSVISVLLDGSTNEQGAVLTLFWSRRSRDGALCFCYGQKGPRPGSGWMHERAVCLRQADSISESIVNSQERERAMELGRLDTFVSSGKNKTQHKQTESQPGFHGEKFFGPEKVIFHLTGILYGWQLERIVSLFIPKKAI